MHHRCGISALVAQALFCGGSSGDLAKHWLFSQAKKKGFGGVLLSNFSLARILTHPKLWRYFEGNMPN